MIACDASIWSRWVDDVIASPESRGTKQSTVRWESRGGDGHLAVLNRQAGCLSYCANQTVIRNEAASLQRNSVITDIAMTMATFISRRPAAESQEKRA
jgi:hypothetical protein